MKIGQKIAQKEDFSLISFLGLPSDTKLLLTKNYFQIIIFQKLRISRVIPRKGRYFPEILRVQTPSKITKNNSQGIIFVIISCQRVFFPYFHSGTYFGTSLVSYFGLKARNLFSSRPSGSQD